MSEIERVKVEFRMIVLLIIIKKRGRGETAKPEKGKGKGVRCAHNLFNALTGDRFALVIIESIQACGVAMEDLCDSQEVIV